MHQSLRLPFGAVVPKLSIPLVYQHLANRFVLWFPPFRIRASKTAGNMGRKLRVDRSPEEKWQIVQEGLKSGNVSETCRRYGSQKAPALIRIIRPSSSNSRAADRYRRVFDAIPSHFPPAANECQTDCGAIRHPVRLCVHGGHANL
jgi:hypothetical protein